MKKYLKKEPNLKLPLGGLVKENLSLDPPPTLY